MNNQLKFDIKTFTNGVLLKTDMAGDVTKEFINTRTEQLDKAVKESLEAQGWTPPSDKRVLQCWLNTETGEFSNSWQKGEFGSTVDSILQDNLTDNSISKYWKLIEYTVPNDEEFEFMNCMRLR